MKFANGIFGMALALNGLNAWGQTAPAAAKPRSEASAQTFYLTNTSQQTEGNEITVAIRNFLPPDVKISFVPSQNAVTLRGTSTQLMLAQKIISDLDRSKRSYCLTYTITETDNGKPVSAQHFAMIVVTGQRTVLKQDSKVPIATRSYTADGVEAQTELTYLDVGINLDASLDESANGVRLRTKMDQLSIAQEKTGVGSQKSVIRQSSLEGMSFLTPGKPLMLGSMDIPGSTRHLDAEVVMEPVR